MESVLKAALLYFVLMILLRTIAGRRTMGELTAFDLLLLLIVGDITQEFLVGDDASLTGVVTVISTFVMIDIALSLLQQRFTVLSHWIEGVPTVLCRNGELDQEALRKARIKEDEILAAARERQGIDRREDIKLAMLEANGKISIVPRRRADLSR
jgi:uncharacterized membrane protein YcaP (DUF421 family)